jgi:hypothetical protein
MRWQELVCYRREGSRPWAGPCRGIEISIPPCFGERTLDESRNTYSRRTRGKGTTNTNRRLPVGYVLPDVLRDRDYAFGPFERGLRPKRKVQLVHARTKSTVLGRPWAFPGPATGKRSRQANGRMFRQHCRSACHLFIDRHLRVSVRYFRQMRETRRSRRSCYGPREDEEEEVVSTSQVFMKSAYAPRHPFRLVHPPPITCAPLL